MPVILALVTLITVAGVWLMRARAAADAAREVAGAVDDARGRVRHWLFKHRANRHPLELIEDPREAAVALMLVLAGSDGVLGEGELRVIRGHMGGGLGVEAPEETLARARWATRDCRELGTALRRVLPLLRARLTPVEHGELIAMLEAVAAAEGPASPLAADAIARARDLLLPRT